MNQMLINVSTRKFKRSVRLPDKQLPLLQAALAVRKARTTSSNAHLAQTTKAA
jgi:hypothetical protein